jgi:hypothetical protein
MSIDEVEIRLAIDQQRYNRLYRPGRFAGRFNDADTDDPDCPDPPDSLGAAERSLRRSPITDFRVCGELLR